MSETISSPDLPWKLPNELILNMLLKMPDLVTLHNFLTAYPQARDLYRICYKKILHVVINRLASMQIKKLVCTVINLRNMPDLVYIEDFEEYLNLHLEGEDLALLIDDIFDSFSTLRDIALITKDIQCFQKSFLERRLRQPCSTSKSSKKEAPPSQIELHRINRAFWRLQLLCELFRARWSSGILWASPFDIAGDYVLGLTHWELEETECVYYHLREQYSLLRTDIPTASVGKNRTPITSQRPIVQRLLLNMGHRIEDSSALDLEVDDSTPWQHGELYTAFHEAREVPWTRHIQTEWSDMEEANKPNEGWNCYFRFSETISSSFEHSEGFPRCGPVICFHNWGYCIWDKERLKKWGVLGTAADGSDVDLKKWSDGNSGGAICDHCMYELIEKPRYNLRPRRS